MTFILENLFVVTLSDKDNFLHEGCVPARGVIAYALEVVHFFNKDVKMHPFSHWFYILSLFCFKNCRETHISQYIPPEHGGKALNDFKIETSTVGKHRNL